MATIEVRTYRDGVLIHTRTAAIPDPTPEEVIERTVEGDLRAALDTLAALIGATTDPAGTTTLRAIKNQTNAAINSSPAASVKALADALITVARIQRKDIRTAIRDYSAND